MTRLAGKVAVITGGAGGIGRAAARLFTSEGAKVLLVDVNEAALREAVQATGSDQASYMLADTTQPESVQQFVQTAGERYGGIDVFLANAGVEGVVERISDYPVDVFDQVMAVNVRGVWLGLKYVMPAMRHRGGSIVITSSTAGIRGTSGMSAYVTSKHAVIGLMRTAALEGAADGIRVNTVNPAPIETRMMRSLEEMRTSRAGRGATVEQTKQRYAARIPLQRYGNPEEVARLMLFLASDESSYCTGGVYMVDGGTSAGAWSGESGS